MGRMLHCLSRKGRKRVTKTTAAVWAKVLSVLRQSLGQVFIIHLAYVALGLVLFTPLLGLVGRAILRLSGQSVFSDFDIAYFLLTPLGISALVLFAALLITILVFEQASLMAVSAAAEHGQQISNMSGLSFAARRARRIFLFALRLVFRILVIVLPFLAVSAAVAWFLLSDYDINYYLTEKPPVFIAAAAGIGLLILTMLVLLLRRLLAWSLALPLLLFTDVSPARSFIESEQLTRGHKRLFVVTLGSWLVAAFLFGFLLLGAVQLLGSMLVPLFFHSMNLLVLVLGGLVALWSLANLFVTTFTSGSFSALLVVLYERFGAEIRVSCFAESRQDRQRAMTAQRFALLLVAGTAGAVLVGVWLTNGIRTVDHVEIIAHRGAAGKAPENTLASIRQAIADGTDWVEIDVQESVDGEVMVIHDSDFMKLAGESLKIWNGTARQLQEIDIGSWFDPKFSGQRVPTLAAVLAEVRGKCRLLIELKYYGHDQQLEQRVVDLVEQAGMAADVAIMSLKYDGVARIRNLRPDWEVGLLSTKSIGNLSSLDLDFLAVNMAMASSGFIRRSHAAGKKVYVWTVNDQVSMSRMMSMGVDGVITDEPELARAVLAERAGMNSIERLLIHTAVLLGQPVPLRTYRDQSP